ncbi:MAG TPA: YigZ family protein [Ignavibacteriales bacterium]|nr:YigZ family protein [Ignavibacteriales bacterium]
MPLPEEFLTIKEFSESKFKEKGSLFIGQCYPVETEEEALSRLEMVRKKYYDATHHCYAYALTGGQMKYSDAGEPSGTAGIRILNAIQHFSLLNLLVVSIRYFGGTKLGVGPLGKAYYNSAFTALESAEFIKKTCYKKILVSFDFQFTSHVHHALSRVTSKILSTAYEDKVTLECLVIPGHLERMLNFFNETLSGKVQIEDKNEYIYL